MAAPEAAAASSDSSGPRFAPDDPTLPAPWKGLIDGTTLYYWNPETNVTQYEKPTAAPAAPPLPLGPPPANPAQVQEPAPGVFSQPSVQFGQVGQALHQERPGQSVYPQAGQIGQQPQQPSQQPPFQHMPQHQASFPQAQQMPYQQQQQQQPQIQQQPPQYPNAHPQHMPYQHGPYMQSQQQQQQQPGSQYSYQAGQQPPMPQPAYNQGPQPPMPQPAYNQGPQPSVPQPSYNQDQKPAIPQSAFSQGQQPQMQHGAYNQGQHPQGIRIPQSQVQHPQQSPSFHQPAQASQLPQVSQSQGFQMTPQQAQTQHDLQYPQHGKQPHHGNIGAPLNQVSHVQPGSLLKDDDIGGHEAKQTGFSLPPGQQHGQAPLPNQQLPSHQHPGVRTQLNISGAGGPTYPGKHLLGGSSPAENKNMSFMSSPAQMHQAGLDTNYRQQTVSGAAVPIPNHIGPSPVRPPMGFEIGNSEVQRDDAHSYGRFDGTNALQQQPKLAALPPSQNPLQDVRNGPPYPRPENFGGYNMAPPHLMPNPHNHGPFPTEASMRPPSRMLGPPDFPSIFSPDAYRQHHEVTAMVRSSSAKSLPLYHKMATTPEEFFVEGLMEPAPPYPSVFLDLPSTPDGNSEDPSPPDNMVPPYILHMLMEDNIDDELLYRCSDHPALLQAQQPFAEILSSPTFVAINDNMDNTKGYKHLLQGSSGDQSTLSSPLSKGADVVGALMKGVEEAISFLPRYNSFRRDDLVNEIFMEGRNHKAIKKRYNRDDYLEDDVRRTSKAMAMMIEEPEEIGLHDILEEMMMHGNETCIKDMEKLRIDMNTEGKKNKTSGGSKAARDMVDLPTLLIHYAEAVAANNHMIARKLLKQIKQHTSATGDARQRLAQCFAKGLEARLIGTGNQLWKLLMAERPSAVELLKAYKLFMAACCFNKAELTFSILTIMGAIVGKRKLHIVDYGMHYGFQWAHLIRLLAEDGGPTELKITAIGCYQNMFCPAQRIEEQGRWLSKCASEFDLPFKFHYITTNWENVCIEDLNTDVGEVLIVNDLFNFWSLMDEGIFFDKPSPRDTVLNNIRKMRPDVFIQSIVNCSYGSSFLSRFRQALFYYTALFDMFDATMPRESESRLVLEQGWFGHHVLNIIACEGVDLVDRPEKYRQWQVRNQRAGLKQLPLRPDIVKVLKDKVKKHHKDFMLVEEGQWQHG